MSNTSLQMWGRDCRLLLYAGLYWCLSLFLLAVVYNSQEGTEGLLQGPSEVEATRQY